MRSIDVHAHLTPQCFWQATEKGGDWHTLRREKDERGQEDAIDELERCVGQLGLKGVEINDHVNGRTLDEPEFRPFWKAADQLGALVFFHQGGETLVSPRTKRYHLPNTVGNLVDRAVTFATLV